MAATSDLVPAPGRTQRLAGRHDRALLAPGETLHAHHHEQAEAYLVLAGSGIVTIDGCAHAVGPGASVFIAGNAVHSVKSTGQTDLRLAYVLAADAFEDVEYVFGK